VAVRQAEVDPALWPESGGLGAVEYLEVGWGDRGYYPDPTPSVWDALDAALSPGPAALHLGGLDGPPGVTLGLPVVRLPVSGPGFDRLIRYVAGHFVRGPDGAAVRIRPGHYDRSWFYEARGRYHAFSNSNTWTARALAAAGVPVAPARALTAAALMRQVEALEVPGAGWPGLSGRRAALPRHRLRGRRRH
jgi:uncharacterized protein (TIGR02117 family)